MSDAAIASIVTGCVTMMGLLVGFLTMFVKLRYNADKADEVSTKVDKNTEVTKLGIAEASSHAQAAADAASNAATQTTSLAEQLNGKLEAKIEGIVAAHVRPILTAMGDHSAQDDKNMAEIRKALGELRDRTVK